MRKLYLTSFLTLGIVILIAHPIMAYEKEIKEVSSTIAKSITESGTKTKTIAVVDLTDLQGNVTELGRFLSEELSVNLTDTSASFEVMDRNHLNSIMAEHKLSLLGITDPKTVKQLGQIAGVDAIVTGCVTPFGDSIRLTAKVILTDTAKVIGATKGDIAKTKAIEELLARGIATGKAVTPSITTPDKPKESTKIAKAEAQKFTFELTKCKISGTDVTCELLITNNETEDRNLTICGGSSRIFDDAGNEYSGNHVQIANKVGSDAESLLISGLPTKARLTFGDVSPQANQISLLRIYCYNNNYYYVPLRNIPLSR